MGSEPRTVSVHILGSEYKIRTTEEGDFVRDVALYVDELMHRISSRMTTGTQTQVAVLAALNIAEELFRERRDGQANGDASGDADGINARLEVLVGRVEEIIRDAGKPTDPLSTTDSLSSTGARRR
jgi:cell division protein ZapA